MSKLRATKLHGSRLLTAFFAPLNSPSQSKENSQGSLKTETSKPESCAESPGGEAPQKQSPSPPKSKLPRLATPTGKENSEGSLKTEASKPESCAESPGGEAPQKQSPSPPKSKLPRLATPNGKENNEQGKVEQEKADRETKRSPGNWLALTSTDRRAAVNRMAAEVKRKLADRPPPSRSALELAKGLHTDWLAVLEPQLLSERFQRLADFLVAERARSVPVYPPADQVFSWSHLCPPDSVRVVILGQDPYHGPRQAHGLAFSVQRPTRAPPSLVNMFKEVASSSASSSCSKEPTGASPAWPPSHGDLTGWARQGVLLLNAVLTVRASQANSHRDQGWETVTEAVIRHLNTEHQHLVFMLWGSHAQKQGEGINRKCHLVLHAPHPSPLSASRGFFGCGHFVKANAYLQEHGLTPVDWTALP